MQSMLELGGSGGMPPRKIFLNRCKILQFRDISTYKMLLLCLQILHYAGIACINGKVSVSSNNHMMHPLTISGNRHVGVQQRFIMADSFK